MNKEKKTQPPMERRPVYVEYIAVRRCRYNPSFAHAMGLPRLHTKMLWDRWHKRNPRRIGPDALDVSARPAKNRPVKS